MCWWCPCVAVASLSSLLSRSSSSSWMRLFRAATSPSACTTKKTIHQYTRVLYTSATRKRNFIRQTVSSNFCLWYLTYKNNLAHMFPFVPDVTKRLLGFILLSQRNHNSNLYPPELSKPVGPRWFSFMKTANFYRQFLNSAAMTMTPPPILAPGVRNVEL